MDMREKIKANFVTRILKNAVFEVVETYTLTAEQQASGVISDQLICLDKDKVPTRLRLVVFLDATSGKGYRYLTNRTDVGALTIALLYQWRWQIERFSGGLNAIFSSNIYIVSVKTGCLFSFMPG